MVPLHTLRCSSSLRPGLTLGRSCCFTCCVVLLLVVSSPLSFKYMFQTNKLITPTSCRDASNHIRCAALPNRCCQNPTESPAKACSDARADKEALLSPLLLQLLQPSLILLPEQDLWSTQQQSPAKPFPRSKAEVLQEQSECFGTLSSSGWGLCNVDLNPRAGFT